MQKKQNTLKLLFSPNTLFPSKNDQKKKKKKEEKKALFYLFY